VSYGFVLLGTQDQADGWCLALEGLILSQIVQIKVHLPGVSVGKLANLEINGY